MGLFGRGIPILGWVGPDSGAHHRKSHSRRKSMTRISASDLENLKSRLEGAEQAIELLLAEIQHLHESAIDNDHEHARFRIRFGERFKLEV